MHRLNYSAEPTTSSPVLVDQQMKLSEAHNEIQSFFSLARSLDSIKVDFRQPQFDSGRSANHPKSVAQAGGADRQRSGN